MKKREKRRKMDSTPSRELGPQTNTSNPAEGTNHQSPVLTAQIQTHEPSKTKKRKRDDSHQNLQRHGRTKSKSGDGVNSVATSPKVLLSTEVEPQLQTPPTSESVKVLAQDGPSNPKKRRKNKRRKQAEVVVGFEENAQSDHSVEIGSDQQSEQEEQEKKTQRTSKPSRKSRSSQAEDDNEAKLVPSPVVPPARKRRAKGPVKSTQPAKTLKLVLDLGDITSDSDAAPYLTPVHVCHICGRGFDIPSKLRIHEANPKVHIRTMNCLGCDQVFHRKTQLREHQLQTGHQKTNGRVGARKGSFSERERAKLADFKTRICSEFALDDYAFNELMRAAGKRDGTWNFPDIAKADLREMYHDVLPARDQKSMNRFAERNFVNVDKETQWTKDDVEELKNLHQEKGNKWTEIAEMLGRTSDAVYRKWKNEVVQGETRRRRRWSNDEKEQLKTIVIDFKRSSGLPLDFSSDDRVSWTIISERMGYLRNAQQCSEFWNRNHKVKTLEGDIHGKQPTQPGKPPTTGSTAKSGSSTKGAAKRGGKKQKSNNVDQSDKALPPPAKMTKVKGIQKEKAAKPREKQAKVPPAKKAKRGWSVESSDDKNDPNIPQMPTTLDLTSKRTLVPASSSPAVIDGKQRNGLSQVKGMSAKSSKVQRVEETPQPSTVPIRSQKVSFGLTQAFDNTQAPTSAISVRTNGTMLEDRPSPMVQMDIHPTFGEDDVDSDLASIGEQPSPSCSPVNGKIKKSQTKTVHNVWNEPLGTDSEESDTSSSSSEDMFSASPRSSMIKRKVAESTASESSETPDASSTSSDSSSADSIEADTVSDSTSDSGSDSDPDSDQPPLMFSSAPLPRALAQAIRPLPSKTQHTPIRHRSSSSTPPTSREERRSTPPGMRRVGPGDYTSSSGSGSGSTGTSSGESSGDSGDESDESMLRATQRDFHTRKRYRGPDLGVGKMRKVGGFGSDTKGKTKQKVKKGHR